MLASNCEEEAEDVWRGARGRGGAVMVVVDARWRVAARARRVWRSGWACILSLLVIGTRSGVCKAHEMFVEN